MLCSPRHLICFLRCKTVSAEVSSCQNRQSNCWIIGLAFQLSPYDRLAGLDGVIHTLPLFVPRQSYNTCPEKDERCWSRAGVSTPAPINHSLFLAL